MIENHISLQLIPNWSASVNISLRTPAHCLYILPTTSPVSNVETCQSNCNQTHYKLYTACVARSFCHSWPKSVVIAKLLYASSAWAGFITAADWQRVDAFFRHSVRCGFCPSDIPPFEELLKASDEQLFSKITHNRHHLLSSYLPPQPHRTTTCDPGHTIDNYLTVPVISQTVTSSPAFSTMTFTN